MILTGMRYCLVNKVLCRIVPTNSVPATDTFCLQCPNIQGIEQFEKVTFGNDRFTELHYFT